MYRMRIVWLVCFLFLGCAGPIPIERKAEPLDRHALKDELRAHEAELHACYERAHDPKLEGRLALQWDIGAKGRVSQVRVVQPLHPEVDDCVAGALENWTFRVEPGEERVRRVLYPFTFRSQ